MRIVTDIYNALHLRKSGRLLTSQTDGIGYRQGDKTDMLAPIQTNDRPVHNKKIMGFRLPGKRWFKRLFWSLAVIFLLMNFVAFCHAYRFTHFSSGQGTRPDVDELSIPQIVKMLFLGIDNPRPMNNLWPGRAFATVKLYSHKKLECWSIKIPNPKGTVVFFHGYGGQKSFMLDKSEEFLRMGYNTLLVDFMGCGGSQGNQTTVGFKEAEDVKAAYDYLTLNGVKNIYFYGTSMGSVAILKAIHDYCIEPAGIMIECPFASLYQTTAIRFEAKHFPTVPFVGMMLFWGSVQNGFWAFSHKPTEYAKDVYVPTLLLYGEKDERVSRWEIDAIFANLPGKKKLVTYPEAGHENYLNHYKKEWLADVRAFIQQE